MIVSLGRGVIRRVTHFAGTMKMTRILHNHNHVPSSRVPTVFVGLSGGVDSSVAAALLQERGFRVVGIHIKMWAPQLSAGLLVTGHFQGSKRQTSNAPMTDDSMANGSFAGVCRQQFQDRIDAMRVAAHLGIPFRTWDLSREYRAAVVDYLIREYAAGRTPNPDVMCNRRIKFGIFLERALEAGADYIATGHYARLMRSGQGSVNNEQVATDKTEGLLTARDSAKDQSYFLWALGQSELRRTLFPVGEFTKPEVREMARKFGLPTAEKPDSQGICFIGEINVREFLQQHIPSERGKVLTASGKAVGEHQGAAFYTIGQRHGIGTGGCPPLPARPCP